MTCKQHAETREHSRLPLEDERGREGTGGGKAEEVGGSIPKEAEILKCNLLAFQASPPSSQER